MLFRQGDVLLVSVDAVPEGGEAIKRANQPIVLAYGETTGHSHMVADRHVKVVDAAGDRYLVAARPFTVRHEEHAPVQVPAGTFKVVLQREYSPKAIRRVID